MPDEVKEPVEESLFQKMFYNEEKLNYSDLLINIVEYIRRNANVANSNIIESSRSSKLNTDTHFPSNYPTTSGKQPLNIHFKR